MDPSVTKLVFAGNPGAGKSFLANCWLRKNRFASMTQASSVTSSMDFEQSGEFVVYDIPGLVEMGEVNLSRNKREITRALNHNKNFGTVIVFVLIQQGGRLQDGDIKAVQSIQASLPNEAARSFVYAINNIDCDVFATIAARNEYYDRCSQMLASCIPTASRDRICFIPKLPAANCEPAFAYSKVAVTPVLEPLSIAVGAAKATVMTSVKAIILEKERQDQEKQRILKENADRAAQEERRRLEQQQMQQRQLEDQQRRQREEKERLEKALEAAKQAQPVHHVHVNHYESDDDGCVLM